jgi:hypothetical protein
MNWGKSKADQLGFEFWLDATTPGRPLYEANGFQYVYENVIKPERKAKEKDEVWLEMERRVPPFTFWLMCRPAGGTSVAKV